MNTKDNLYVNAADICLSMESWPDATCSVEIRVGTARQVRTLNLDEYTKKVQDDMMEALRVVLVSDNHDMREAILIDGRGSIYDAIRESSGHEFMERYEKWKSDEKNKLKREQIEAAKKLLRENGFKVVTV